MSPGPLADASALGVGSEAAEWLGERLGAGRECGSISGRSRTHLAKLHFSILTEVFAPKTTFPQNGTSGPGLTAGVAPEMPPERRA